MNDPTPPLVDGSHLDPVAADELRQIVAGLDPRDAGAWYDVGRFYFVYGYFPEAAACYRRAAELAPDDPELLYDFGFCLDRLGRSADAVEQMQRAIEAGNKRPEVCWHMIGRCAAARRRRCCGGGVSGGGRRCP